MASGCSGASAFRRFCPSVGLTGSRAATCADSDLESLKNLHQNYRRWAERNGERLLGSKRFSQILSERGLNRFKSGDVRGFRSEVAEEPASELSTLGGAQWRAAAREQALFADSVRAWA